MMGHLNDFSTSQSYKNSTHSVETVFHILKFDLSQARDVQSRDAGWWQQARASSQPCDQKGKQLILYSMKCIFDLG